MAGVSGLGLDFRMCVRRSISLGPSERLPVPDVCVQLYVRHLILTVTAQPSLAYLHHIDGPASSLGKIHRRDLECVECVDESNIMSVHVS